jgi:hypothetical protein
MIKLGLVHAATAEVASWRGQLLTGGRRGLRSLAARPRTAGLLIAGLLIATGNPLEAP